jgi:hypothetical protein
MPKIIAIRSTTNDINTTVFPARYRNPSRTAPMPHRDDPRSSDVAGMRLSRYVAQIGSTQVTASIRYRVDRSTQLSMMPASSGPTIDPNCVTVMLRALAAGSWSPGRMRGIAAALVGELMA